jgi:hypothetical protein
MVFKVLYNLRRYKVLIWRIKDAFREMFRRHIFVDPEVEAETERGTRISCFLPRGLERGKRRPPVGGAVQG